MNYFSIWNFFPPYTTVANLKKHASAGVCNAYRYLKSISIYAIILSIFFTGFSYTFPEQRSGQRWLEFPHKSGRIWCLMTYFEYMKLTFENYFMIFSRFMIQINSRGLNHELNYESFMEGIRSNFHDSLCKKKKNKSNRLLKK